MMLRYFVGLSQRVMGAGRGAAFLWAAVLLLASPMAASAVQVGANIGVGFGSITVRPLGAHTPGLMVCAGLRFPVSGALQIGPEFALSSASPGVRTHAAADPGKPRLTTVALAAELGPAPCRAGGFASLGVGIAQSTLKDPYDRRSVPDRTLTALGVTAGAGYRLAHKPDRVGFTLALRAQFMPHSGQIAASAYAVTFGLAY